MQPAIVVNLIRYLCRHLYTWPYILATFERFPFNQNSFHKYYLYTERERKRKSLRDSSLRQQNWKWLRKQRCVDNLTLNIIHIYKQHGAYIVSSTGMFVLRHGLRHSKSISFHHQCQTAYYQQYPKSIKLRHLRQASICCCSLNICGFSNQVTRSH